MDASTLINFVVSSTVHDYLGHFINTPIITPIVADEAQRHRTNKPIMERLIREQRIIVEIAAFSYAAVSDFSTEHDLGFGESESILSCMRSGRHFCCDDRKARRIAEAIIGKHKITGSIGTLKLLVQCGCWDKTKAYATYLIMRERGAFLPDIEYDDL